jgi:hypothetical protein
VLHELPPPRTGQSGRPRTKGARLGTPADLAATAIWRTTQVRRYGRTDTVDVAEIVCLWYGSFHSRTVRVVLVRDNKPRTNDRDERGYGLPLVTTDLTSSVEDLVARYAPPVVYRGRVLATPARSWVSARPATAPAPQCNAPCHSG